MKANTSVRKSLVDTDITSRTQTRLGHQQNQGVVQKTCLMSPSMRPSSVGTPTRMALSMSGSSWLAFNAAKMSAVACRLRDQTMRSRGKWRTRSDSFEMILACIMSSPTSLADCTGSRRELFESFASRRRFCVHCHGKRLLTNCTSFQFQTGQRRNTLPQG